MNKIQFPVLMDQMGDVLTSDQVVLVLLLLVAATFLSRIAPVLKRRRRPKGQYYPHRVNDCQLHLDMRDPADQICVLAGARFERRRVMNRSEFLVFQAVERVPKPANSGYRVMIQTSLGKVISASLDAKQNYHRQGPCCNQLQTGGHRCD